MPLVKRFHRVNRTETSRGDPRGLVAALSQPDGTVLLAMSRCGKGDRFDKHRAHVITDGRLVAHPIRVAGDQDLTEVIEEPFDEMLPTIRWTVQEALRRQQRRSDA
jgi:hypothetical protein